MTRRKLIERRRFLQMGVGGAAALAGALGPVRVLHAAPRGTLGSGSGDDDYRALVCVFLFGGADTANLLVPRSTPEYTIYSQSRQDLAVPQGSLLPITPITPPSLPGAEYGLNAAVPELAQRFEEGKLGFVANIGPLVAPITKAEFEAKTVPVPPRLFSHNDQQLQWQLAEADALHGRGWCGRLADRVAHLNGVTPLSTNISLGGPVPMLVGETSFPYSMNAEGSESLALMVEGSERQKVFEKLLRSRGHALEDGFIRTQQEAIEIDALISEALPLAPGFEGTFPAGIPLAAQLRMVAQLISVRAELGMKRQVFFVSMGGYDTHDQQNTTLSGLYRDLSLALDSFQQAIDQIGAGSKVTTFTSSDFGRTLSSNGKGSDHGWASHAMVLGGAVRGGDIYGAMPDLTLGGPDNLDGGRTIPKISIDQYAATMSRWFGLPPEELETVFPNLAHFAERDLGFL